MYTRPVLRIILFMTVFVIFCFSLQPASADTVKINGFGIGSDAHLRLGIANLPQAYAEQQRLGIRWARESIPWEEVELSPGSFRWTYEFGVTPRDFPTMLATAEQYQIEVVALLAYGPGYFSAPTPDELIAHWPVYVQAVVDQFGDQIDYWEIGNEMDSREFWGKVMYPENTTHMLAEPDPLLYARMLSIAYDIIKAADPQDTVILGGLVTVTDSDCPTNPFVYLGSIYRAGAWDKFDVIGFHPYWGANPPEAIIERGVAHDPVTGICLGDVRRDKLVEELRAVVSMAAQFGAKPVWITEIGWSDGWLNQISSYRGATPDSIEADYVVRTYVPLLSEPGVENIFWYTQIENDPRINFELGEPGLQALGNLATLLTGSTPLGQFQGQNDQGRTGDSDVYEYRFARNNELIVVVWKARGGEEPLLDVTLSGLEVDRLYAFPAVTTDLSFDAGAILEVVDGQVKLDLTEHPVLLRSGESVLPEPIPTPPPETDDDGNLWDKLLDWWHNTEVYQAWQEFLAWLDEMKQMAENVQDPNWWIEQLQIKCCGSVIIPMGLVVGGLWLRCRKPGAKA